MSGHKHHLVPRHAGGDDSPENLTPPISIRLHAAFHWDRWKHVGDVQDKIAAFMLLGRITSEEARIAAARIGAAKRRGVKLTEEWIKNVSKALTGRKRKPFSLEHRANLRRTQLGRVRSPQAVAKTRAGLTGKPWSAKRRAATPLSTKNLDPTSMLLLANHGLKSVVLLSNYHLPNVFNDDLHAQKRNLRNFLWR